MMSMRGCVSSLALLLVCAGVACTQQPPSPGRSAHVRGTATYHERMALPPGAVFEATVEEVSRTGATSGVVARTQIERPGNPPIAFDIAYDPVRIDPGSRYVVRARILVDGKLFFTTDRTYPVLTAGHGSEAALLLRRARDPAEVSDEPLENTYWKLTDLGFDPVTVVEGQREPHFILHPPGRRVSGFGGCNRFTGSYELEGDRLVFGRMAGTMMACPQGMETEKRFLEALGKASRTKVTGQRLDLLDASGGVVARFEAVHLK